MEVIKEGTHTYLLRQINYGKNIYDEAVTLAEEEQWNYYLSVEYEVLKRNKLKTLVSVQLREKDGEKSFLFDITGKCSLKHQGKERAFSKKKCEKILQSMQSMMQEVDDYMLDLNCIEYQPEYIYEESEDELQWIYFPRISSDSETESDMQNRKQPNKDEDLQKRIESLFAWMLTQIDYEDTEAVQFMYRFYNKVRKRGFSKELLETYIQSEIQKEYYDIGEPDEIYADEKESYRSRMKKGKMSNNDRISYDEFFKEELESERKKTEKQKITKQEKTEFQMENSSETEGRSRGKDGQKNKGPSSKKQANKKDLLFLYTIIKIMAAIGTLVAVVLEGMLIFYGISRGFTRLLFRYSVGGMLLIIVFICGFIWSTRKVRMIKQDSSKSTIKNDMSSIESNIRRENKVGFRKKEAQETQMSDRFIQKNEFSNRPQMIRTEVDWESELEDTISSNCGNASEREGTTILNCGNASEREGTTVLNCTNMSEKEADKNMCCPMLRDMELGIVYIIKSCPFYIGSAEGVNHLQIRDKTVSREHAVILEDIYGGEQEYIIRDMDSTNGTWINGKRIKRGKQEQLKQGMIIRFAKKEYEFLIQDL